MKALSIVTAALLALAVLAAGPGLTSAAQSQKEGRAFSSFKGLIVKTGFQSSLPPAFAHGIDAPRRADGSLGFRLTPNLSLVGTLSSTTKGLGGGGESLTQLSMVNVVYDFNTGHKRFRPFLNLGAGIATHDIYRGGVTGLGIASESIAGLAWGGGAGMDYVISDSLSLTGSWRYTASSGSGLLDKYDLGVNDHSIRMGMKYKLPARRMIDPAFRRD